MNPLYRLATLGASALYLPGAYLRSAGDPALRRRLRQRIGRGLPFPDTGRGSGGCRLWLQAVSVGEVRTAATLLPRLTRTRPGLVPWLSSTTPAGLDQAARLGPGGERNGDPIVRGSFSFPLDLPWIVRRVFDHLRPSVYGSVETELWPGILSECTSRGVPAILVNGSLSERSARRWGWVESAVREGLRAFRAACVQSERDAERLARLGMPPGALVVTGNVKFDIDPAGMEERTRELRRRLRVAEGCPLVAAGSTAAGEERILLEAWEKIRRERSDAVLLIAPRQPARFDQVFDLIRQSGLETRRATRMETEGPSPGGVLLLDTLGDLEAAYGMAQVAFVGGSLVPRGGQNPIEPAAHGVPVLFGPGMENFREIAGMLMEAGAARQVRDADELAMRAVRLLGSEAERAEAGSAGRRLVASHQGATDRTIEALGRLVPELGA